MATTLVKGDINHLRGLVRLKRKRPITFTTSHIWVTKTGPYSTSTSAAVDEKESGQAIKPFSEIPGPKGLPIVGTLFQYPTKSNEQLPFLKKRCNEFYPIYRESVGANEQLFLYDVEEIERLFRNEAKYPRRFEIKLWTDYRRVRGNADGLFTSQAELWHRMRKAIDKPMLRIKDVSGYADDVNEVVTDFLERLGNIRQADGLIPDLERELFNWSLETIGLILYEKRFGGLSDTRDPEMQRFIYAIKDMFIISVQMTVFPLWVVKTVFRHLYKKHMASWDTLFTVAKTCLDERVKEIVDSKEQDGETKGGLLSYLLSENSLPVEEIYSNITELMIGAVDTTSTAMLWTFQELALHPEVQDKLLAEVTSVLPDGEVPTYQDLQKMPYLKAVVKETLRKYPVGSGVNRITEEDREICGYHVPAQTSITVFSHVMNRLPQYFENPDEFRPERWLRGSGEKPNPFLFSSFGFGTRMCVGRRVAELEMHMFLSQLIRKFSIEPGFTKPAIEAMELVLRPDRPIKIKLIDRK